MPNHTPSYSTNGSRRSATKRPTYRKKSLGQLHPNKPAVHRRPGAVYLSRSGAPRSGQVRRAGAMRNSRPNKRAPYALIAVACALAFFIATVVLYNSRNVDIKLNGEKIQAHIGSSIEQVIKDKGLDSQLSAGNLLAVNDSVLKKGGGERYSVICNKKRLNAKQLASTRIQGGEKLTIKSGRDRYEKHDVQATETMPSISKVGSGAVTYIKKWGQMGRSEVWVGKQSGKTADRGEVKKKVDCVIESANVNPSGKKRLVALTFNASPSSGTSDILNILQEKGVHATFFIRGENAENNPGIAQAIAKGGHEIGSSGYDTTNLTKLRGDDLRTKLRTSFSSVKKTTGKSTALLRAPGLDFDEAQWAEAGDLVSAAITYNVDSGDWNLRGADSEVNAVVSNVGSGSIVLFTDNADTAAQNAEALPQIIDKLLGDGYSFVTVSDLIKSDSGLSELLPSPLKVKMPKGASLAQYTEPKTSTDGSTDASEDTSSFL